MIVSVTNVHATSDSSGHTVRTPAANNSGALTTASPTGMVKFLRRLLPLVRRYASSGPMPVNSSNISPSGTSIRLK